MFGIGFWELVMILIALVVFLRPTDVPRVIRELGRLHGRLTSASGDWTRAFEDGMKETEHMNEKAQDHDA